MSLNERLFELRQRSNKSLQNVADAVGVSKAHIWELEKGRTANPSFDLVQKLATYFGVTPDMLVGTKDVPPPSALQIERIHRDLKNLSDRDLGLIEEMVQSMNRRGAKSGE